MTGISITSIFIYSFCTVPRIDCQGLAGERPLKKRQELTMNQSKTTLFRGRNLKGLVFLSPNKAHQKNALQATWQFAAIDDSSGQSQSCWWQLQRILGGQTPNVNNGVFFLKCLVFQSLSSRAAVRILKPITLEPVVHVFRSSPLVSLPWCLHVLYFPHLPCSCFVEFLRPLVFWAARDLQFPRNPSITFQSLTSEIRPTGFRMTGLR